MHMRIGRPEGLCAVAPPTEQLRRGGSQECGVGFENRQGGALKKSAPLRTGAPANAERRPLAADPECIEMKTVTT